MAHGLYKNSAGKISFSHAGHKTPDARINNAWLGGGDKKKLEAFDLLLAIGA